MNGILPSEASRGGRAHFSRRLDGLTSGIVRGGLGLDILTRENVQTQGLQHGFWAAATAQRREPETHFLPV
jgi:hypothetical protein